MTPERLAELAARAVVILGPKGPPPAPLLVVFAPDPVLGDFPAFAVALPADEAREIHTAGAKAVFAFADLVMPRVRAMLHTDWTPAGAEGVTR